MVAQSDGAPRHRNSGHWCCSGRRRRGCLHATDKLVGSPRTCDTHVVMTRTQGGHMQVCVTDSDGHGKHMSKDVCSTCGLPADALCHDKVCRERHMTVKTATYSSRR
eukprot:2915541-Amphidinium_carterae.1